MSTFDIGSEEIIFEFKENRFEILVFMLIILCGFLPLFYMVIQEDNYFISSDVTRVEKLLLPIVFAVMLFAIVKLIKRLLEHRTTLLVTDKYVYLWLRNQQVKLELENIRYVKTDLNLKGLMSRITGLIFYLVDDQPFIEQANKGYMTQRELIGGQDFYGTPVTSTFYFNLFQLKVMAKKINEMV